MSKLLIMFVMFFTLLMGQAAFASTPEEAEAKCRVLAEDEEILKDEMAEFMQECLSLLTGK